MLESDANANLSSLNVGDIILWHHLSTSTFQFENVSGSHLCAIPSTLGVPGHIVSSSVLPNHICNLAYSHEQSLHWIPREWQHTTNINMRGRCIQNLAYGTRQSLLSESEESGIMMAWVVDNQPYAWASLAYSFTSHNYLCFHCYVL